MTSKTTEVTFEVRIEYANERRPTRREGFEMHIARVWEYWPVGDGKTRKHLAKEFEFWSAGKANQEADRYVAETYANGKVVKKR